jgi:hypothetical protein
MIATIIIIITFLSGLKEVGGFLPYARQCSIMGSVGGGRKATTLQFPRLPFQQN